MRKLTIYERILLNGWEDVYKMGQLSLWLMLALKDGPKHMTQIKAYITTTTDGVLSVDDKSIYRSLRRYTESELVAFTTMPSGNGPSLKVYSLTPTGEHVLGHFISRNIDVFYKPTVRKLTKDKD